MLKNFEQVREEAKRRGQLTVCVAAAQDMEVLEAVRDARDQGLVKALLVGDVKLIEPICDALGFSGYSEIIDEPDVEKAAMKAVTLVRRGNAQVLVKGQVNSSILLHTVLDQDAGLRSGKILCHLAAFEIPGERKLAFFTDGGMNIAPNLEEKKEILFCALDALLNLGIARPNVAILAANEKVNDKMPATTDAKSLVDLWEKGSFPSCIMEGPVAMDVAASEMAARQKGIASKIAGNVDLFLVPSIEAGNMIGKTLVHYAGAKIGGVIIGASHPVVMVSRSDNAEAKLNSIALASLIYGG